MINSTPTANQATRTDPRTQRTRPVQLRRLGRFGAAAAATDAILTSLAHLDAETVKLTAASNRSHPRRRS